MKKSELRKIIREEIHPLLLESKSMLGTVIKNTIKNWNVDWVTGKEVVVKGNEMSQYDIELNSTQKQGFMDFLKDASGVSLFKSAGKIFTVKGKVKDVLLFLMKAIDKGYINRKWFTMRGGLLYLVVKGQRTAITTKSYLKRNKR